MTAQNITMRSQGGRNPSTLTTSGRTSRRPQSGYERGLTGTLQKNDGWRDESLLTSAGKIVFYPLSFDVLETLSFPRDNGARTGPVEMVRSISVSVCLHWFLSPVSLYLANLLTFILSLYLSPYLSPLCHTLETSLPHASGNGTQSVLRAGTEV